VASGVQAIQSVYEAEVALSDARARLAAVRRQIEARRSMGVGAEGSGMTWTWRAPVGGVIDRLSCAPGTMVGAGQPCLRALDVGRRELRVRIPQRYLPRLTESLKVRFVPGNASNDEVGVVLSLARRDPVIDERDRSQAHYFVPERDDVEALPVGTPGRATVLGDVDPSMVRVPPLSVVQVDGAPTVFVPRGGDAATGSFEALPVFVVGYAGDDVIVHHDRLPVGALVVERGAFLVKSLVLLGQE